MKVNPIPVHYTPAEIRSLKEGDEVKLGFAQRDDRIWIVVEKSIHGLVFIDSAEKDLPECREWRVLWGKLYEIGVRRVNRSPKI